MGGELLQQAMGLIKRGQKALIINTVNSRNEVHLISPYKINMSFSRQVAIATGRN